MGSVTIWVKTHTAFVVVQSQLCDCHWFCDYQHYCLSLASIIRQGKYQCALYGKARIKCYQGDGLNRPLWITYEVAYIVKVYCIYLKKKLTQGDMLVVGSLNMAFRLEILHIFLSQSAFFALFLHTVPWQGGTATACSVINRVGDESGMQLRK